MKFNYTDRRVLLRALDLALGDRTTALETINRDERGDYRKALLDEIGELQAMRERFAGPKPPGGYKSR